MILWFCVAVRIVTNPFSNVFQKLLTHRDADPLFMICAIHALLSLACLPILCSALPPLPLEFWFNMSIGTLLTVSGNVLIVQAVKRSDLSVLGPINAYKSVVSLLPGFLVLGEVPGAMGLGGIALIVAGSYFLVDQAGRGENAFARLLKDRGVQYRFAALFLSAIEAVFLKKALLKSTPLVTFAFWSLLGFGTSLLAVVVLMRGPKRPSGNPSPTPPRNGEGLRTADSSPLPVSGRGWGRGFGANSKLSHEIRLLRSNASTYLMLFVTTGLMQLCTIVILVGMKVGYALALFQISTIISVLLGWRVFREKHIVKRLVGSFVMIAGALLIIFGG